MSFWTKSDGETLNKSNATAAYEDKDNFEPIPDGTSVIAAPTHAVWDTYDNKRYISVRWDVVDGQYKGRVVFHKLHVLDSEDKRRNRALEIFAAIAKNAGGSLLDLESEPTDGDLSAILNKPMAIRLRIWEWNEKTGNWVDAVSPAGSTAKLPTASPVAAKPAKQATPTATKFDDDIPF